MKQLGLGCLVSFGPLGGGHCRHAFGRTIIFALKEWGTRKVNSSHLQVWRCGLCGLCSRLAMNSCNQHNYLMPTSVCIIAGQNIKVGILGNVDVFAFSSLHQGLKSRLNATMALAGYNDQILLCNLIYLSPKHFIF